MTSKELVIKALNYEGVPRIPVMTMSGVTWALRQRQLSPQDMLRLPDYGADLLYDTCRQLGVDIVYGGRAIPYFPMKAMGGVIDYSEAGVACDLKKKPIEEIGQLRALSVPHVMQTLREDADYERLQLQTMLLKEKVGEELFVGVGSFGPFTTAGQIIGMTELLYGIMDEETWVEELLAFAEALVYEVLLDGIRAGGNLLFLAEPVASGDLINPDIFETYALPSLKRVLAGIRKECPYVILHICGKTDMFVEKLRGSGISLFSVDSIDIPEAIRHANGEFAIMGNLSPTAVMERSSEEEVYQKSLALCKSAGLSGGFFLAPGCDLAPATPIENIRAMRRASEAYAAGQ